MAASFAGVFYVGVTAASTTSSTTQRLVVTSVGSVSTASTIHRMAQVSADTLEVQLGGPMYPTSLQDPNLSVQVFDAHFVGPESETDALVKRAQELFDDPDRFFAAGDIDQVYRDSLNNFKKQISHCAINVMRIRTS